MRISYWSSDVCSSDLSGRVGRHRDFRVAFVGLGRLGFGLVDELAVDLDPTDEQQAGLEAHTLLAGTLALGRSEERRVGKEGVSTRRDGGSPEHEKKKSTISRTNIITR